MIYTAVNGDIKRVILRVLEIPVREMGMASPEILKLVENCPKGAETLITRIIHILTEQSKISAWDRCIRRRFRLFSSSIAGFSRESSRFVP